MDSDYNVRARRVVWSRCREQVSILTPNSTGVKGPTCNMMNPVPTYERSGSQGQGIFCRIKKPIGKAKAKVSDWWNKMSAPLSSSGSRPARKRALLIGVTYEGKLEIKGTINDVKSLRKLLITNFGFKEENIWVLTEEETLQERNPTRKNILGSMEWLVKDCQAGDSLVFYFSGHGSQEPHIKGDERDGLDEVLCPVDFKTEGTIRDNEINSIIVWPLKKGVTLLAIVDACHSGTVLDLEYVYDRQGKKWEENSPPSGNPRKHTDGGLAISLSACLDDETATDTSKFTKKSSGAMTHLLTDILKNHPELTYGGLLDLIHEKLTGFNERGCRLAKFFRKISKSLILQKPQLSSSQQFDVYKKHFIL